MKDWHSAKFFLIMQKIKKIFKFKKVVVVEGTKLNIKMTFSSLNLKMKMKHFYKCVFKSLFNFPDFFISKRNKTISELFSYLTHPFVYLSVCLSVCLSVVSSFFVLSVCLYFLSLSFCVCLFVCFNSLSF